MPQTPDHDPLGQPTRPTLRTLADRTGLHMSTVSRALRRTADSDATAALVHQTAAELGYRPDPLAASLRTRRSGAIGMVAHSMTDVAQAIIYEEVDQYAVKHGYDVLVASTRDDPDAQRKRVELLLSRRVDGLLIADAHRDGQYADWVASLGVPYVLVMRDAGTHHPAVVCDDAAGGRMVAEHLLAQGHRTVALLAGPDFSDASHKRALGYREALAEHGVELPDDLVEPGGLHATTGREAMERLLARRRDFTAVFCANDFVAFGATTALQAAGLTPGEDVATVGYNDLQSATTLHLSTIRTPQEDMGQFAAAALLEAIDGGTPGRQILMPELVVRGSSTKRFGSAVPRLAPAPAQVA
jgi:LacI family transcriptional regulator